MAERHPRDLELVRIRLLKECERPLFAANARYHKPLGKGVEGPSIRFAERAIQLMTNISIDQIAIFDDRERRIIRVIVADCETNTPYSSDITINKTVERRSYHQGDEVVGQRTNKAGNLVYTIVATDDDLFNKQNAAISKAIRNNALRLIPPDIVDECMDKVKQIQKIKDAKDPGEARKKIFDAFDKLNVPPNELKLFLGHTGETLTEKEIANLRGLHAALKEGEITWREVMEEVRTIDAEPAPEKQTTTNEVKDALRKKKPETVAPAEVQDIWPRRDVEGPALDDRGEEEETPKK